MANDGWEEFFSDGVINPAVASPHFAAGSKKYKELCERVYLLYEPAAQSPTMDIVFLHGIGSDEFKCWTNESSVLWPATFIPQDYPTARVISVGYSHSLWSRVKESPSTRNSPQPQLSQRGEIAKPAETSPSTADAVQDGTGDSNENRSLRRYWPWPTVSGSGLSSTERESVAVVTPKGTLHKLVLNSSTLCGLVEERGCCEVDQYSCDAHDQHCDGSAEAPSSEGSSKNLASFVTVAAGIANRLVSPQVSLGCRPVVFVVHSMGGLLLKVMLTELDRVVQTMSGAVARSTFYDPLLPEGAVAMGKGKKVGPDQENVEAARVAAKLLLSVHGAVFYGTPHFGSPIATVATGLGAFSHLIGVSPTRVVTGLGDRNQPDLFRLNEDFMELIHKLSNAETCQKAFSWLLDDLPLVRHRPRVEVLALGESQKLNGIAVVVEPRSSNPLACDSLGMGGAFARTTQGRFSYHILDADHCKVNRPLTKLTPAYALLQRHLDRAFQTVEMRRDRGRDLSYGFPARLSSSAAHSIDNTCQSMSQLTPLNSQRWNKSPLLHDLRSLIDDMMKERDQLRSSTHKLCGYAIPEQVARLCSMEDDVRLYSSLLIHQLECLPIVPSEMPDALDAPVRLLSFPVQLITFWLRQCEYIIHCIQIQADENRTKQIDITTALRESLSGIGHELQFLDAEFELFRRHMSTCMQDLRAHQSPVSVLSSDLGRGSTSLTYWRSVLVAENLRGSPPLIAVEHMGILFFLGSLLAATSRAMGLRCQLEDLVHRFLHLPIGGNTTQTPHCAFSAEATALTSMVGDAFERMSKRRRALDLPSFQPMGGAPKATFAARPLAVVTSLLSGCFYHVLCSPQHQQTALANSFLRDSHAFLSGCSGAQRGGQPKDARRGLTLTEWWGTDRAMLKQRDPQTSDSQMASKPNFDAKLADAVTLGVLDLLVATLRLSCERPVTLSNAGQVSEPFMRASQARDKCEKLLQRQSSSQPSKPLDSVPHSPALVAPSMEETDAQAKNEAEKGTLLSAAARAFSLSVSSGRRASEGSWIELAQHLESFAKDLETGSTGTAKRKEPKVTEKQNSAAQPPVASLQTTQLVSYLSSAWDAVKQGRSVETEEERNQEIALTFIGLQSALEAEVEADCPGSLRMDSKEKKKTATAIKVSGASALVQSHALALTGQRAVLDCFRSFHNEVRAVFGSIEHGNLDLSRSRPPLNRPRAVPLAVRQSMGLDCGNPLTCTLLGHWSAMNYDWMQVEGTRIAAEWYGRALNHYRRADMCGEVFTEAATGLGWMHIRWGLGYYRQATVEAGLAGSGGHSAGHPACADEDCVSLRALIREHKWMDRRLLRPTIKERRASCGNEDRNLQDSSSYALSSFHLHRAHALLAEVLHRDPKHPGALCGVGRLHAVGIGSVDADAVSCAQRSFTAALAYSHDEPHRLSAIMRPYWLSSAAYELGMLSLQSVDDASHQQQHQLTCEEWWRRSVDFCPCNESAVANLGLLHLQQSFGAATEKQVRRQTKGLSLFRLALAVNPGTSWTHWGEVRPHHRKYLKWAYTLLHRL